jgi:hypothetical protein
MMRYSVSKRNLETICLMALRQSMRSVQRIRITSTGNGIGQCNWEVRSIEPMPNAICLENAMARLGDLQSVFNLDLESFGSGEGGITGAARHDS